MQTMRFVVIASLLLAGCCQNDKGRAGPPIAEDLSEPVTLKNPRGGTAVLLLNSDTFCVEAYKEVENEDYSRPIFADKTRYCRLTAPASATIIRRKPSCVRVALDSGPCKGWWWIKEDWTVPRKGK